MWTDIDQESKRRVRERKYNVPYLKKNKNTSLT